MNNPMANKYCLPVCLAALVLLNHSSLLAAEPATPARQESSLGLFSWLNIFSVSPEERDAREAALRAKADARSAEMAAAVATAKDPAEKARLEKEAAEHATKEQQRRSAFEKRKTDEEARAKARAEAEARIAAERKADEQARAKARAEEEAREAADEKAREVAAARRDAERKADEQAKAKARTEAKVKAEQEKKQRDAALAKAEAERKTAREAALKAKKEQHEKEQAQRTAALQARLKAAEEARARSEAEAKARAEQETKARIESVTRAAAERKAKEEARVKADLERRSEREKALRDRSDARSRDLAASAAAAKDPKERESLQKEASQFADKEAKRRAAFEESQAETKARWDARVKVLDEREKREAEQAAAPIVEKPKWKFSAGVIYRAINSQTFKSDSYSRDYDIPDKSRNASHSFSPPGDANSIAERDYIDGYVYKDVWTDFDGGTWNWGYDDASQVQGNTLVMSWLGKERSDFSRETSIVQGDREKASDSNSGVYLRAERIVKQTGPLDFGLRLDASRVAFSSSGDCATFSDSQRWATYYQYNQDSYSLAGTGITPSSPPYHGDADTPGPAINNAPDSRESGRTLKVSSGSYDAFNYIKESLDLDLYTLSLGMSLAGNYRRLFLAGALGPTLTLADTDASYEETLFHSSNGGAASILAMWNDSRRDTDYNVGLFVQGELGLRLIRGFELSVFGRYDWTENVSGNVGQMRYVVNPEGGSFGGTVTYAF